MDGLDSLPISDEAEQVDGEDFFVGKIRVGVVALSLGDRLKAARPVPAHEQIDADKRILPVSVFCQSGSFSSEESVSVESAMSPRAVCERGLG
jgi:hypothetical protein